jgi:plastocyanin
VIRSLAGVLRVLAAGSIVVACGATSGAGGSTPSAPPGGVVITAASSAFDRSELKVPAGRPFPLLFENLDGAPHNVTIYDGPGGRPSFVGEIFGGPESRTYQVPSIPAGAHRFRCDVHPDMSGTVLAGPG